MDSLSLRHSGLRLGFVYLCPGCGAPSQSLYHVPVAWLRSDANLVVLLEEGEGASPAAVKLVQVHGQ